MLLPVMLYVLIIYGVDNQTLVFDERGVDSLTQPLKSVAKMTSLTCDDRGVNGLTHLR